MKAAYTYTKNDVLAEALDENFDAAARDKFKITSSSGDLDYAHIVDEEIDALVPVSEEGPDEYVLRKKDLTMKDIDLSSFKPKKQLEPHIWINGEMNSRVRLRLMDIADDFIDTLDVDWVKPKDIILTGSLANYNYSKYSDFDLHVVIDFEEVDDRVNFVKEYFDAKKKLWNEQHENLKIYGYPVELYVQDSNEFHNASGVYSLNLNAWIRKPSENGIESIKLNKFYIKEKVLKLINKIDELCELADTETDEYRLEEVAEKANALFKKIRSARKIGLKRGGEMDSFNIIFKCLRRFGYIGKLVDLKTRTYDKLFSIK